MFRTDTSRFRYRVRRPVVWLLLSLLPAVGLLLGLVAPQSGATIELGRVPFDFPSHDSAEQHVLADASLPESLAELTEWWVE